MSIASTQYELLGSGTTFKEISLTSFNNFILPTPPINEQISIAAHLDDKCAQLDAMVANEQAQIEKLKQYRKSVITQAVTKGLDPTVPMKDSGVEWIGEIPVHWSTCRVKDQYSIIGGNGFSPALQGKDEGDYPVCKASDISNAKGILARAANYISETTAKSERFNIIPQGSVLFAKIGEAMKKNNRAYTMVDCCADNNCQAVTPKNGPCRYSLYLFSSIDMSWFDNAGTIPCVNNQKLLLSKIPNPPLPEQQAIAAYLDTKCTQIDKLIAVKEAKIAKLGEYKKSLIYEYVTGKREIKTTL